MVYEVRYYIYEIPVYREFISSLDGSIAWNPRFPIQKYSRRIWGINNGDGKLVRPGSDGSIRYYGSEED
jgi:hypothetical protein